MKTSGNYNRRSAPKVRDGKVQKKNRTLPTTWNGVVFDRESPRPGYRHVVSKADLKTFVTLLPDWESLFFGVERVLLSRGGAGYDGLYETFQREGTGIIELSAWSKDLWFECATDYFDEHSRIFEIIDLPFERKEEAVDVRFTVSKAKAFMLLHVFVHELGHHRDRMTTRNRKSTTRGEAYAEDYANRLAEEIYPKYFALFGRP